MKKLTSFVVVCAVGAALSGCIVIAKNETPPGTVVVPQTTEDSVAFAEIDAAGKLDFEQSRLAALNGIASRTNLSPTVQVRLVDTAFKRLDFEQNKVHLFETLIKNPAFANPAKQTLLMNLNKLSFDQNRSTVLRLLNERGDLKA
jgi:hypothetical protein